MFKSILAVAGTLVITSTTPILAGNVQSTGTFVGKNDHITTGGVSVVKAATGGYVVILDEDFSLDGAPDPKVGFGKNGEYNSGTDLGALENISGFQVYVVPANIEIGDFNEIYVWCEKFSVPLGVAALTK